MEWIRKTYLNIINQIKHPDMQDINWKSTLNNMRHLAIYGGDYALAEEIINKIKAI